MYCVYESSVRWNAGTLNFFAVNQRDCFCGMFIYCVFFHTLMKPFRQSSKTFIEKVEFCLETIGFLGYLIWFSYEYNKIYN